MMNKIVIAFFSLILFSFQIFGGERSTKTFTFVKMTAPQLGFGGYKHDLQSFEQTVKQINELNLDFVDICSDLVNAPADSSFLDFKRIKEKFEGHVIMCSGTMI